MLPGTYGRSLGELEGICAFGINLETRTRLSRDQTVFLGENIGGMWSDLSWFSHGHGGRGNSLAPPSSGQAGIGAAELLLCWDWCWRGFTAFCLLSSSSGLGMRTLKICRVTCCSREVERTREKLQAQSSLLNFTHHIYSQFVPWWLGCFHPGFCSLLQILFLLQVFVVSIARECWSNLYL